MGKSLIKIGTRGSALALKQAQWVKTTLEKVHGGTCFELVIIKTTGDKILDSPLSKIGDKGLFTREIEEQLLAGTIDMAVHSMKDLPTSLPEGLALGAVTKREDPRDVFIARKNKSIAGLGPGDIVATGSLRRRAQLLQLCPGLSIVDMRGNLNTRLDKLDKSTELSGIILAHAGLIRLDMTHRVTEIIPESTIIPAVGQASLAVEIRSGDRAVEAALGPLHHHESAIAITCERSFLAALGGGCQVPIAGHARVSGGGLTLTGMVASLDGAVVFRETASGPVDRAASIGEGLAGELLRRGAREVLNEIYHAFRSEEERS